ncbi:MAG: hypothetical protein IAE83_16405 [Anaerolinea sp.]|nr:hypothetical protein [Anaerolinea sp.]MCC6975075.1 hypothetical protein [Anaerolineae bacterium]CAG1013123.1 hypothetical protein ANRL4_04850 [Anaerolineae bacterium]
MSGLIDTLSVILINAYILFSFALGAWAGVIAFRGERLSGSYFGAAFTCTGLAVICLIAWLLRTTAGEQLRWVYGLYIAYFIVVYPGTFALLRGRDDRLAAWIFAGVAIFTAFSAISASDPGRGVIVLPPVTPAP